MKFQLVLGLIALLLLAACGPSKEDISATVESRVQIAVAQTVEAIPTQTPYPTPTLPPTPTVNPISASFREQLNELLRAGNAVTGATRQGVSFLELRRLVNEARGAYDLTVAMWPDDVSTRTQRDFEKAFQGWELTLYLWDAEIEEADQPVEPDVNRYRDFVSYSDQLILDTHPDNYLVRDYRGKQFVPFDNVEVLMSISAAHYESGQEQVLSLLE